MKKINSITFTLDKNRLVSLKNILNKYSVYIILYLLIAVSAFYFSFYLDNGLGLAYNDARSHLDIGRRVVEGLKPGLAQLGSVWLPLPHLLMVPAIWNDFMWHSGLAGALQSMISFVATGIIIYLFLGKIGVGFLGRVIGVLVFAANVNVLYLQSTAMTELLLLAMMTAGVYELMLWFKDEKLLNLIKSSFWIML
ncbi:MAG: family 2 glycosyl transferase, partial [Candidatus Levybacteria bacterium]|nr:family 2 glycosyl transferase [Candidatus Levybacteria bacterium]